MKDQVCMAPSDHLCVAVPLFRSDPDREHSLLISQLNKIQKELGKVNARDFGFTEKQLEKIDKHNSDFYDLTLRFGALDDGKVLISETSRPAAYILDAGPMGGKPQMFRASFVEKNFIFLGDL